VSCCPKLFCPSSPLKAPRGCRCFPFALPAALFPSVLPPPRKNSLRHILGLFGRPKRGFPHLRCGSRSCPRMPFFQTEDCVSQFLHGRLCEHFSFSPPPSSPLKPLPALLQRRPLEADPPAFTFHRGSIWRRGPTAVRPPGSHYPHYGFSPPENGIGT